MDYASKIIEIENTIKKDKSFIFYRGVEINTIEEFENLKLTKKENFDVTLFSSEVIEFKSDITKLVYVVNQLVKNESSIFSRYIIKLKDKKITDKEELKQFLSIDFLYENKNDIVVYELINIQSLDISVLNKSGKRTKYMVKYLKDSTKIHLSKALDNIGIKRKSSLHGISGNIMINYKKMEYSFVTDIKELSKGEPINYSMTENKLHY